MSLFERLALAGILLLALGLRLTGIGFGLDLSESRRVFLGGHNDERGMAQDVRAGLLLGDLHPRSFLFRGPGGFVLFGAADAMVVAGKALANEHGWQGVLADLERNPSLVHLVHRLVSALAGVLSVWLLVSILRREFDTPSALAAGLCLATSYAHVRNSQVGAVDALWALATLASFGQMLRLIRDPRPGRYVWSGLLMGTATALKYLGALGVPPLLVAHALARSAARRAGAPPPGHARALLALAACPLGFLLLFPGVFGAAGDFVAHLEHDFQLLAPRAELASPLRGLDYHLRYTLAIGLGEPVFVLALAGLVLAWRRGPAGRFLVLSLLLIAPTPFLSRIPVLRYGLVLLVWLAAPAGIALAACLARLPRALGTVLVVVVVAPSLVRSTLSDRLLTRRDTRDEMLALVAERAEPPERVLAFGHTDALPRFEEDSPYRQYALLWGAKKLDIAAVLADPPHTILLDLSDASRRIPGREELQSLIASRYREVRRLTDHFEPGIPLPDPVTGPGLFVPYARPWTMTRPGPPLVLYERAD
jgi:hypothetical protein